MLRSRTTPALRGALRRLSTFDDVTPMAIADRVEQAAVRGGVFAGLRRVKESWLRGSPAAADAASSRAAAKAAQEAAAAAKEDAVTAVAAAATSPPDTPLAEWREHHDEGSGRTYYSNLATKARSWTLPDGGVVVEYAPSVLAARAAAAAEAEAEAEAEATAAAAADAAAAAAPAHENSAAAPVDGAEMWTEHYADGSDPPSFFYVHRTTGERVWSLPAGGLHTPAPERASSASHEEGGDGESGGGKTVSHTPKGRGISQVALSKKKTV